MTPLAYSWITRGETFYSRPTPSGDFVRVELGDVHCFEISEVVPIIDVIAQSRTINLDQRLFLPFEKTWFEFLAEGHRSGYLAYPDPHPDRSKTHIALHYFGEDHANIVLSIPIDTSEKLLLVVNTPFTHDQLMMIGLWAMAAIYVINSPKVVDQTEHEPHKKLQREARAKGKKAPFRWSKVHLSISRTSADSDLSTGKITGQRALHHVRRFARIRLGKLELVNDHWRGKAKNGVVFSDHKVMP